jgi:hypothetical protein
LVFAYIVRCNFTAPDRERAWNDWYSGPKIEQMLRNPQFRSGQRFRRLSGNGRDYLALWIVQSPEAFRTPEYLSQWGFSEWTPLITDWSRDLFDGGCAAEQNFAVAEAGALHVVAFDGMSRDDTLAARDRAARSQPAMMWLPVTGLDRHTPLIGLRVLADLSSAQIGSGQDQQMQQAVYRPISAHHSAGRSAA